MAKTSMIEKAKRKPKFGIRRHNRCQICGRPRGFLRFFNICRVCFREYASQGKIPGVRKASF